MQFTTKRSVALAVAGLVVGTVGALSVPALADNAASHRKADVQAMTLDFTGTNDEAGTPQQTGTTFGGRAVVKDTNGKQIGEAFDVCAKDDIKAGDDVAFCTGTIDVFGQGKISFSTVLSISDDASKPVANPNEGVVNGGTGAYEGITGQVKFTPRAQGVFDANFS